MEIEKQPVGKSIKSFIFPLLRFAFRLLAGVLLFCYVFVGMNATNQLYKRNMYQAQDIGSLYAQIDDATQRGNSPAVTAWLRARPLAETDKLVDIITPKSAPLDSDVFFEIFRRQLQLGRTEEAFFWLQMGRYRLLYDIIRCGAEPKKIKIFDPLFKSLRSEETDDLVLDHPEVLKKTAQRVLDFDTRYPAHNNPAAICKIVLPKTALPVDEENWEGYHQLLRQHTEDFLKGKSQIEADKIEADKIKADKIKADKTK